MSHIRVAPELHLILNPTTGVIAEEKDDVVEYSLDAVKTQLDELDKIVTDMMNQLEPNAKLLNMFPEIPCRRYGKIPKYSEECPQRSEKDHDP